MSRACRQAGGRRVWPCPLRYSSLSSYQFTSVQLDTLFNTGFSEAVGLLEEIGFQSTPELAVPWRWRTEANGPEEDCPSMTGAATMKLRLPSSVAVLGTTRSPRSAERRPARPERFVVGTQTCWKYAGPAPRTQVNARNAVSIHIR